MIKGIDVSYAQGAIDWSKVDVDFAIIRAGYGREISQKDRRFEKNYAGCKSNNIPVGCYWYSYALTPEEAKKEAAVCLEVIKGKTFEYPIYFDIEESAQAKLSQAQISEICKAFCDVLEAAGYWVGIYSYASLLSSKLTDAVKKRYAIWVAHTGVSEPNYKNDYGIWQYSHSGKVTGITGNVDLDYCYVDYPIYIKTGGLNNFKAPSGTPAKSITTIAKEVIQGKWGNGIERKNKLTQAGYDYNAVQTVVNDMLK